MPSSPAPLAAAGCRSSASTIATDMATGWHDLTVLGYSGTKGLGVGKHIASVPFTVGGHRWSILYYPDGDGDANADHISVFLRLDGQVASAAAAGGPVLVEYKFSLLNHQTGQPAFTVISKRLHFAVLDTWGYRRFIRRRQLDASRYFVKDDSFRLRCDVTVFDFRAEATPVRFLAPPSTDLHRHLGDLLDSELGADVTFKVGSETFAAHLNVLAARSPVFKAELFGWLKEKKQAEQIQVDDVEPRVFEAMLRFIYTDSLPEIDEGERRAMAQHLLVAADRYRLEKLKLVCEDLLRNFIDAETVATTLALAAQHGCRDLKQECFSFMKYPGNMRAVVETDGFEHLMNSCPSVLKELIAKISP